MATTRRRLLPGGDEASSTRSFNIYSNHKSKCLSLEERIEDWAESNTVLGGLYLLVAILLWRYVLMILGAYCESNCIFRVNRKNVSSLLCV